MGGQPARGEAKGGKGEGVGTLLGADLSPPTQKPLRMSQLYFIKQRKPGAATWFK